MRKCAAFNQIQRMFKSLTKCYFLLSIKTTLHCLLRSFYEVVKYQPLSSLWQIVMHLEMVDDTSELVLNHRYLRIDSQSPNKNISQLQNIFSAFQYINNHCFKYLFCFFMMLLTWSPTCIFLT